MRTSAKWWCTKASRLFALAAVAMSAALASAVTATADERTVNLTLALFSDIYELSESNGRGGFARIAAAIKRERAQGKNVIVAHAGDTLSPSLYSGVDQGAHIIDLTNRLAPDIFVPGNHEFDYGADVFLERMREATFPVLAANLTDEDGRTPEGIARTKVLEIEGVRLGIVGLTADDSREKSNPGRLQIAPVVETLRKLEPELRSAGCDLVVAVVHAGRREDLRLYLAHSADIILSGDDHDLALLYDGKAVLAEAMADGDALIAIDLTVRITDRDGRREVEWRPRFRIVDTADVEPDKDVAELAARYDREMSVQFDVAIGRTETEIDSSQALVRASETAIGNLIADAIRGALHTEVAIFNGGGIRGNRIYKAGASLTRRDVFTELPFTNKAVALKLSGADLKSALENGLTFGGKPSGRFPQVSGLTILARKDAVPGSKIASVLVGSEPLDPNRMYTVATNDFLAAGKEGYDVLARAERLTRDVDGPLVSSVVMDYIAARQTIAPKVEGRLRLE